MPCYAVLFCAVGAAAGGHTDTWSHWVSWLVVKLQCKILVFELFGLTVLALLWCA